MKAQENTNLRDQLFPEGIPEPEEFIKVIANFVKETTEQTKFKS